MKPNRFGYNSVRWIKQDWRFIVLTGNTDTGLPRFRHDTKCGKKGGVLPDGRVRLCLPLAVIKELKRTKDGKLALKRQVLDKLKAPKGVRVPYNETVLQAFKAFQKSDTFENKQRTKGKPVQIPLFDFDMD